MASQAQDKLTARATASSAGFETMKLPDGKANRPMSGQPSKSEAESKPLLGQDLLAYITTLRCLMQPLLGERRCVEGEPPPPPLHEFLPPGRIGATWLQYTIEDLDAGLWDLYVSDVHPNLRLKNDLARLTQFLERFRSCLEAIRDDEGGRQGELQEVDAALRQALATYIPTCLDPRECRRLLADDKPSDLYLSLLQSFHATVAAMDLSHDTRSRCVEEFRLKMKEVLTNQILDKLEESPPETGERESAERRNSQGGRSQSVSLAGPDFGSLGASKKRLQANMWAMGPQSHFDLSTIKDDDAMLNSLPSVSLAINDLQTRLRESFEISPDQHETVVRSELALHGHRHVLINELRQRQYALDKHPHYNLSQYESLSSYSAWRKGSQDEIIRLLRAASDPGEMQKDTFTGTLFISVLDACPREWHKEDPFMAVKEIPTDETNVDPMQLFHMGGSKGFLVDIPYPVKCLTVGLWDDEDLMDRLFSANLFNPWAPTIDPDGPQTQAGPASRQSSRHSFGVGPGAKARSGSVLDEYNQPAIFVGEVELPLSCLSGKSRAGEVEGWFRFIDPVQATEQPTAKTTQQQTTGALPTNQHPTPPPSPPATSPETPTPSSVPEGAGGGGAMNPAAAADEDSQMGEKTWCVRLHIRYVRGGFKRRELPDYHELYRLLAQKLISGEIEAYKAAKDEQALSVGAWQQYREREAKLWQGGGSREASVELRAPAPCPTNIVSGNDGNGLYPGPVSLPTLCVLWEYATRYGIGPVNRKLALLDVLADFEMSGNVDIDVIQALLLDFLSLVESLKPEGVVMTKEEQKLLVCILDRLVGHQVHQLTKYKDCFPNATPTGALQSAVRFLRLALCLQPYCTQYTRTYPPLDTLLVSCVKDGAHEMFERLSAVAMPEYHYNQRQAQGVPPDTHKMLDLAGLILDEIRKDQKYFNAAWPFDLMQLTVPIYLTLFAAELANHFSSTDVEASVQIFDLYFRLKELRSTYRKYWDSVSGDKTFPLVEWFMPFVFDWMAQNDTKTMPWAVAALDADQLVPEQHGVLHSASVAEVFLLVNQGVAFLEKLDFPDQRVSEMFATNFVQSLKDTAEKYLQRLIDRCHALQQRLDQSAKAGAPETVCNDLRKKMCVCANNTVALRSQLADVYRSMGTHENIVSGVDTQPVEGRDNPIMCNDVVDTLSMIKMYRQMACDTIVAVITQSPIAHMQKLVWDITIRANVGSASGPAGGSIDRKGSLLTKSRSVFSRLQGELGGGPQPKQEQKLGPLTEGELERMLQPFLTTTQSYVNIVILACYPEIAHEVLLGAWRMHVMAGTGLLLPEDIKKRGRKIENIQLPSPEAVVALNRTFQGLKGLFISNGSPLTEADLDLDGRFGYLMRCLADYQKPTTELTSRWQQMAGKSSQPDPSARESVAHIGPLLATRRHDYNAQDFLSAHPDVLN